MIKAKGQSGNSKLRERSMYRILNYWYTFSWDLVCPLQEKKECLEEPHFDPVGKGIDIILGLLRRDLSNLGGYIHPGLILIVNTIGI